MKIGMQCYIFEPNYTKQMHSDLNKIQNVIFDLGGVIIDLDTSATFRAFGDLFNADKNQIETFSKEPFFEDYEVGKIDDPTFRAHIRESFEFTGSDELIDSAWNAMLGKIDKDKIELIEKMSDDYRLFVMSNTNDIHIRFFNRLFEHVSGGRAYASFFTEVYLSQEIGERKPNPGAWQVILNDHQLAPETCLFIDDKQENIEASEKLGIQGFQNVQPRDWMSLFS